MRANILFKFLIKSFFVVIILGGAAHGDVPVARPLDWISHRVESLDTRAKGSSYFLEVIELKYPKELEPSVGTAVFIPGLFQNGFVFDLLPESGVSFARYVMSQFKLKIYFLHVRGIGLSDYPRGSCLDDIAIDDIPAALKFLVKRESTKPLFAVGHSQGAITLQASMAGLSRCGDKNCFNSATAVERQGWVRGLGLLAGSVAMTSDWPENYLPQLSKFGVSISPALAFVMDRVPAPLLTHGLSPTQYRRPTGFWSAVASAMTGGGSAAYWSFWEFLYHIPNVSRESIAALYGRTLDHSTTGILAQFAKGVSERGVTNSAGERYADYLKNIKLPLFQATFGLDPLAEPQATFRDSFVKLGSTQKKFFEMPMQGHEDFLMNSKMALEFNQVFTTVIK